MTREWHGDDDPIGPMRVASLAALAVVIVGVLLIVGAVWVGYGGWPRG